MKKTLLTTLASAMVAACACGQGTVSFSAGSGGAGTVQYSTDGLTATPFGVGNPSSVGGASAYAGQQLHVDFFAAPNGTVLTVDPLTHLPNFTATWTDLAQPQSQVKVSAGRMSYVMSVPQTGNLAGTAGNNFELEIVGWTGTATTWAQAIASGGNLIGFTGEQFNGAQLSALGWSQASGNNGITPPTQPSPLLLGTGGNNYAGLVLQPVPEPTTIVLGGLGAAALLLFRRRK